MNHSITVVEISDPKDPLFTEFWLPLYREAFPDAERLPESSHEAATEKDDRHILIVLGENDKPVGMARLDVYPHEQIGPYAYLMYAAVAESERNMGYGSLMLSEFSRFVSGMEPIPPAFALEVEDPAEITDPEAKICAERRIGFYKRNGFRMLTGVRYFMKVPDHNPVYMHVMVKPVGREFSAEIAYLIAQDLAEGEGCIEQIDEIGLLGE